MKRYKRLTLAQIADKRRAVVPHEVEGGYELSYIVIPKHYSESQIKTRYSQYKMYETDELVDYVFDKLLASLHKDIVAYDYRADELIIRDEKLQEVKDKHNNLCFVEYRCALFGAMDIYEKNVLRGRVVESRSVQSEVDKWYKDMCDNDIEALRRTPQSILRYLDKDAVIEIL